MERVALKVQRRRFYKEAVREVAVHQNLRARVGSCPEVIEMREAFIEDEHVCMVFERHGVSLYTALARGALPYPHAQRATRQILLALEHLHRAGYAHTDVKPDNILYRPRSGSARLADLGDAAAQLKQGTLYGTRQYTPPEVLLGTPLTFALDLWSLGCTVFEMLTARPLFDPRAAAAEKYREFSSAADAKEIPLAASVLADQTEEKAEQLSRKTTVAAKYRLLRSLGRGRFGTVWAAEQLHRYSLDASLDIIQKNGAPTTVRRDGEESDRKWRHEKGASDLLDLALNYEQVLLMAAVAGPFPSAMIESARYRASYFEDDGALRFRPATSRISLRERLRRAGWKGGALDAASDFLRGCLTIDPTRRFTAAVALRHPWLALA